MFDVGNTPLVEFEKIRENENLACHIFGKMEYKNPAGSTKDRIVKQILDDAIADGRLRDGDEIVEATSGNTGIALAAYGGMLGHAVKIFMPENMSQQRIDLMRHYGAEVVLTPASENVEGSITAVHEYIDTHEHCFLADQFNNLSNTTAHFENTAREIWDQTNGEVGAFIAGIGTGGTLKGVGDFLKEKNPNIYLAAVLPAESPHVIQGIGDGFDPPFFTENKNIDEVIKITNAEAMQYFD